MLRELILSVASGVIVALIMQIFGFFGRRRRAPAPRPAVKSYDYAPPPAPQRRSFSGRVVRFVLSVIGGIALAQTAAPFLIRRGFADFDRHDRHDRFDRFNDYDRFNGFDGWTNDIPILGLTILGTIICYMILSVLTRR